MISKPNQTYSLTKNNRLKNLILHGSNKKLLCETLNPESGWTRNISKVNRKSKQNARISTIQCDERTKNFIQKE